MGDDLSPVAALELIYCELGLLLSDLFGKARSFLLVSESVPV